MILTVNIPKRGQKITNGDIIKAIFPNIDTEQIEDIIDVYGMSKCRVTYDTDWWNAPYKTESNEIKIDGKVVTGRRMSDGEPITGFVVGTTPFTYILPEDEVRKACCTGEQQVKIEITAERILAHD